jgi:hypothetical protein
MRTLPAQLLRDLAVRVALRPQDEHPLRAWIVPGELRDELEHLGDLFGARIGTGVGEQVVDQLDGRFEQPRPDLAPEVLVMSARSCMRQYRTKYVFTPAPPSGSHSWSGFPQKLRSAIVSASTATFSASSGEPSSSTGMRSRPNTRASAACLRSPPFQAHPVSTPWP